jgi:heme exporter protein C
MILVLYAPAGFAAMVAFAIAVAASLSLLRTKKLRYDALAVSATEVGLVFLVLNIATGAGWSHASRGIWWTWDPAITSALVWALIQASYLMLRRAVEEPGQRAAFSAVWSIFCCLDMPIVVAAVYRWRAQHPQPPLWAAVTGNWPAQLAWSTAVALAIAALMLRVRLRRETARRERESARRMAQAM